jgi:hypothetical protein
MQVLYINVFAQPFLIRLVEVDRYLLNCSGNEEKISFELRGKQAAGAVFINHRVGPLEHTLLVFNHRDRHCRLPQQRSRCQSSFNSIHLTF